MLHGSPWSSESVVAHLDLVVLMDVLQDFSLSFPLFHTVFSSFKHLLGGPRVDHALSDHLALACRANAAPPRFRSTSLPEAPFDSQPELLIIYIATPLLLVGVFC